MAGSSCIRTESNASHIRLHGRQIIAYAKPTAFAFRLGVTSRYKKRCIVLFSLSYGPLFFDMTTAQFIIPNPPKEIQAPPTNIKSTINFGLDAHGLKVYSGQNVWNPNNYKQNTKYEEKRIFLLPKKTTHVIKDATATSS